MAMNMTVGSHLGPDAELDVDGASVVGRFAIEGTSRVVRLASFPYKKRTYWMRHYKEYGLYRKHRKVSR